MAKKDKVTKEPKANEQTLEEVVSMLIDMETNELKSMMFLRNRMSELCANKQATLINCGKMIGLDTSLIETLKVD